MARYFITGGSGFVGTAIVSNLLSHNHKVLALARSDESAAKLTAAGASVIRGDLTDLESLKTGASQCDGTIHAGFVINFSDPSKSLDIDHEAMKAIADVYEGTGKPLIYTNGSLGLDIPRGVEAKDETYREDTIGGVFGRRIQIENWVLDLKDRGIRSMSVRLSPSVHGENDHQFVPFMIKCGHDNGFFAYPGDGENLWTAVNKDDAANLYRLAMEKGESGCSYHACAEWISVKQIAEILAKKFGLEAKSVPVEEIGKYLSFLEAFITLNAPVKTDITRSTLGWEPVGPTLEQDIEKYY